MNDTTDNTQQRLNSTADEKAVNIIRDKINNLYKDEPDAREEVVEAQEAGPHSKHQKFMNDLVNSGKSLADIQTQWHKYYTELSDKEKHVVWHEFYEAHGKAPHLRVASKSPESLPKNEPRVIEHRTPAEPGDQRSYSEVKKHLDGTTAKRAKISGKHHIKSLAFGLMMGSLVMLVMLFSFFNERFIAPFITPSRDVSSAPILIDPSSTAVSGKPEIVIPKINVEIPVVYSAPTSKEADMQKALESGVAHYPSTPKPGEQGNAVIVGHSSNNIFNQGKYKFAFVLLKKLNEGDTFYINRGGTRYAYKVYEKKIVAPDDVSVLNNTSKRATATLITCDPPGTSLKRLVVVGEQISPSPNNNAKSTAKTDLGTPEVIGSNAPSLWHRLWTWLRN